MGNWLKIGILFFLLLVVSAFFLQKQDATSYDTVIMSERNLVIGQVARLHLSMACLKEDSLQSDSRQLGESLKKSLIQQGFNQNDPDFEKMGVLQPHLFISSALGIEKKNERLLVQIEVSIRRINDLETFRDNFEYREAALAWMKQYKSLIGTHYRPLIDLFKLPMNKVGEFNIYQFRSIIADLREQSLDMDEEFDSVREAFHSQFNVKMEKK